MNRRKKLPSPERAEGKKIEFSVDKKIFIQITVLILLVLIIVGCMTKNVSASTQRAYCNDGFQVTEGTISAKSSYKYWIVDDDGYTREYLIQDCSIK